MPFQNKKSRQSQAFSKRKKNRRLKIVTLIIICAVSWIFALQRLTKIEVFSIETVEIFGADNDISNSLRATALESMQGDYIGLFSRSSTLTYPRGEIMEKIKSISPKIDMVSIKRKGLHGLVVSVNEKTPSALICNGLPDFGANNTNDCYFADANGFIFKKAGQDAHKNLPKYFFEKATVGSYATSTEKFKTLQVFYETLKTNGISVQSLLLKEDGEYEFYARNPDVNNTVPSSEDDPVVIYFNDKKSLSVQLENLVSFWNHLIEVAKTKKEQLKFDYIDVRYGPNVFYQLSK